jgi:predicted dehydrogenase/threonine dehydrogenase-like Zn-dependent dehydrogenase
MKQILARHGTIMINEVPAPLVGENSILVQVYYSCISAGTEVASIASSGQTLFQKVISQPEKAQKAIEEMGKIGLGRTIQKIKNRLEQETPLGYSAAGMVLEVGKNLKGIKVGDKVACVGAGIANHAEYIDVPRNLFVKIPDEVEFSEASTVALGSIAIQGLRRASVALGEYVAVIGLGILGQLTCQLLKANGCRVIGIDLEERRIQKALEFGIDIGLNANSDFVRSVISYTDGFGVDAVIITAATVSSKPLSQSFQICRKKGRVVLVGSVGMEVNREDMYAKELDFMIATSYGPGRYDEEYESQGIKYPYAYVRWTETRNMEEYLKLLADRRLNLGILIEREFSVNQADEAYQLLQKSEPRPLIILLKYNSDQKEGIAHTVQVAPLMIRKKGRINIAVIGAGDFASNVHLPNLMQLKNEFSLSAVAGKNGAKAKALARQFSAGYATTDYEEILRDTNIDAVIIATRHNLHAKIAIETLKSGKAVLLEKPMALNRQELNEMVLTIEETKMPFMVGFNRRFSAYAQEIKRHVSRRINPLIINYQMNAGYIPLDQWVHTNEGGGRIIGEACHIFDLFVYFVECAVKEIYTAKVSFALKTYSSEDNFVSTITFEDGSICNLTYTALGNQSYPKEQCQILFDGKVIVLDDYRKLSAYGFNIKNSLKTAGKGHLETLRAFARYIQSGENPQVSLWQHILATEIGFQVSDQHENET